MLAFLVSVAMRDPEHNTPTTDWEFRRLDPEHVRIVYTRGAPIPADEVRVTVDGIDRYPDCTGQLTEGTAGTVDAPSGSVVRVYWTGETGDRTLLASWHGSATVTP